MTIEIFLPFWGDPELLYKTVDSVRAQKYEDWKLIVLDDQYPDLTVPEYFAALKDERITYIRNEKNLGITDNYREAIRLATTEFISILGCDDLLHPNYLDVIQRAIAEHPDADVIQPGVEVIDEHGVVGVPLVDRVKQGILAPKSATILRGQDMATSLIRGDWLYWPSLTFKTSTLKRIDFRDGLPIIQDLALLMDIAFEGGALAYTPELSFSYRRHSASASQKTILDGRRFRDERTYYKQAIDLAKAKGWSKTSRTARFRLMSRLHAVTEIPGVIKHGNRAGLQSTLAHIFAI